MESTLLPAQVSNKDSTSCSTTDACGWQIVSASVPGAIHIRGGAPNQDALSWWSAEGGEAARGAVRSGRARQAASTRAAT